MKHQKVECCLKCGSVNFIKKGKNTNSNQRYFCNDCKKYFQPKIELPFWVKKAYNEYSNKCMFLKDLSIKYNKSIPTINKYFDILISQNIERYNKNQNKIAINLVFDAIPAFARTGLF